MALISGVLTNYVEDGYLNEQDDYITNGILNVNFTIAAELIQSAWTLQGELDTTANFSLEASLEIAHLLHEGELTTTANFSISTEPTIIVYVNGDLDLNTTTNTSITASNNIIALLDTSTSTSYECSIYGLLTTDIPIDITSNITFDPVVTKSSSLAAGMITNWSALGSPTLSTPIDITAVTSFDATANMDAQTGLVLDNTFLSTILSSNTKQFALTISSDFDTDITGGNQLSTGTNILSSFSSSIKAGYRLYSFYDLQVQFGIDVVSRLEGYSTRYLVIPADNRNIILPIDDRVIEVLTENRILEIG